MRFVGIDPSTKTGFVELDDSGNVIQCKEIHLKNGIRSTEREIQDYARNIVALIPKGSFVCIEDFSFGSQGQAVSTQYGVGFALRFALINAGLDYKKPTPSQLKKFATGKGNTKKDEMVLPIYRGWGFEHSSDNVRDAFVLAQMAKGIYNHNPFEFHNYQLEVLQAIENPAVKKLKKKA
ncbi:hypothetical protein [Bacillus sp. 3255]|uniref:hypothetical protein n=1 Tax=Bacillus sp. 3255 TaxID=2817904 RepID=UPI00285CCBFB|nr:hypothetical protein [Bacillus sp. 3255]MDR6884891.1 crossover junction endodeoxyribonuclease RuvC [Bacillus sp. 3255]